MEPIIFDTSEIKVDAKGLVDSGQMWPVLAEIGAKLAENWFIRQCNNHFNQYYLYYKKSSGKVAGQLAVFTQEEAKNYPEFELANANRISLAMTEEQAAYFMFNSMRSLEILPS